MTSLFWIQINLRTIKFNDGSPITQITDNATWQKYNGTAFCYYQNTTNLDSIKKMGALYNWNVVNTGRLAPEGWHVPSDSDWNVLLNYLISQGFGKGYVYGSSSDSLVAKSIASRTGWKISKTSYLPGNNPHSSNITGFSARPSYARMQTGFFEKDDAAFWWSSTSYSSENALYRSVHWDLSTAIEANRKCNKNYGFSIRLIKDPTFSISTSAINGSIKKSPDKPFYKNGEKVTLEAIPNNGFRFQCWNGDVSGSTSLLSVTMQKNLNLSAVFSHGTIGYSLTVNSSKNGVIKIDPLRPDYDSGEVVTLTAVPSNGYVFTKWSGDAIGIETVAKLNMDRNMNVTAHFAALCTLEIVGSNGSVLKKPEKALYIQGDTVNITVTPNQGYTFAGWSGDAGGNSTSLNVVVNSSKRIKANCIADSTDSVVDIDGNVYHTIRIGNQIWTVENLRSTKYTDGTQIEQMSGDWTSLTRAAMRFQYMDSDSIKKFGALYNGFAVNTQKLAPAGWHIPSDEEWKTMIAYLVRNGYNYDWTNDTTKLNTLAKALSAKTCWGATVFPSEEPGDITNDMSTNNSSGFSALPAGYYTNGIFGTYQQGCWWTMITNGSFTTPYYYMQTFSSNLQRGYTEKTFGCSVRLVKN
ncbi:MAG TPA: FISUMP domain-containing protein [Chitinispirillaceae bacterium]|nr:FISUMP domain-containing protein [Chitinispirillaceae bacterium]